MKYPQELLPKTNFIIQISLSEKDAQSLYVTRRSLVSREETTNELGSVRSHAFIPFSGVHLFFSLSCNLLGIFQESHLCYRLGKEGGGEYYTGKDQIPDLQDVKFSIDEDPLGIYLNAGKIHHQPFHFEKKKNEKIYKFLGTCTLIHRPLRANYWHFEIEVLDENKQKIKPNDADWKTTAARLFFESYLKANLSIGTINCVVDSSFYLEKD